MNEKKHRIVCFYPSEEWAVQETVSTGWMEIHRCTAKGKEGYEEAKKWMEENL